MVVRFWEQLHPQATWAMLGYLPGFLDEADPDGAEAQFDKNYRRGGGFRPSVTKFRPINGFRGLTSPGGDPPLVALYRCKLRDEWVYFYDHAWVLVLRADGTWVVARMD